MRIVALLGVRNEELYLGRAVDHLRQQGVDVYLLDNGSTDATLQIGEALLGKGICGIEQVPYEGFYDWTRILATKERLASEIDADWFIHHDADEIREAPLPHRTLLEGVREVDRQGYNAINFDEFVFLPTGDDESYEGTDYVARMPYYYFFEQRPLRRVNAWKNPGTRVDLTTNGGHQVCFADRRVFPTNFVLRHYIALSKAHALSKYGGRVYSMSEVTRKNWHGVRARFHGKIELPPRETMCRYEGDGRWDRSTPRRQHVLLAGGSEPRWVVDGVPGVEPAAISEAPVPFIVGAGRSGATLLGLVLDHHPELAIPPETHFMGTLLDVAGEGEALRRACHDAMVHSQTWKDQHVSEVELWNAFAELPEFTVAQGLRAFYRLYRARFGKERWGEKTPGHGLIMSGIQRLLPEARFVHVIRDGRDVALSPGAPGSDSGDDLASRAVHWMWNIREIRQQGQLCRKYLEVRHEELVLDTERCLRRICEFIELPYHPVMLDYHRSAAERLADIEDGVDESGRAIGNEEARVLHSGSASPPDGSRLFRWKREMSAEDRRSFEAVAGNMLKDLGY